MKRRVLLFNPASDFYAMPLGLLAVGSALPADVNEVTILDARLSPDAESRLIDEAQNAACVGMTVFSGPSIGRALKISRELKGRFPKLPIVWGGWHPSILPEQCIASGAIDAVVTGQGEQTFKELLDAIDNPSAWPSIPGLCCMVDGKPRRTPPRPLVRMDGFPPVRYELLDVGEYFHRKARRQLDYSSSRGCPYKCTFCADPLVYESKWTGLPAKRIVAELQDLYSTYRMDEVFFLDDDLFASLNRIKDLVSEFKNAKIPFTWKGTARADELCRLPEDFFKQLKEARCERINVGAESGSQHVLDRIKKQYKVDQILTAARRTSRAGIGMSYSFIAGFPGEKQDDFQATIDVLKEIHRETSTVEAHLFVYSPYPGTELARELQQNGMRLPERLEDWDDFNVDQAFNASNRTTVERRVRDLNFYLRHGYSQPRNSAFSFSRAILKGMSRFRVNRDWYAFPVERYLAEALTHHAER